MKKLNPIFKIMKKCKCFADTKEYVGHLTSTEICTLMEAGAKIKPYIKYQHENAKADKEVGKANPQWFYFIPPKGWGEK
jgi:hypothetical protein